MQSGLNEKCLIGTMEKSMDSSNLPDTEQVVGIPTVIDLPLADDITIKNLQMSLIDAEDAGTLGEEELDKFREGVYAVVSYMLSADNYEGWLFELEKIRLDIKQERAKTQGASQVVSKGEVKKK